MANDLEKGDPKGGRYHRRVTDPDGNHRYYYDEKSYARRPDAHIAGADILRDRLRKELRDRAAVCAPGVTPGVDDLVKRYGAEDVQTALGEIMQTAGVQKAAQATAPRPGALLPQDPKTKKIEGDMEKLQGMQAGVEEKTPRQENAAEVEKSGLAAWLAKAHEESDEGAESEDDQDEKKEKKLEDRIAQETGDVDEKEDDKNADRDTGDNPFNKAAPPGQAIQETTRDPEHDRGVSAGAGEREQATVGAHARTRHGAGDSVAAKTIPTNTRPGRGTHPGKPAGNTPAPGFRTHTQGAYNDGSGPQQEKSMSGAGLNGWLGKAAPPPPKAPGQEDDQASGQDKPGGTAAAATDPQGEPADGRPGAEAQTGMNKPFPGGSPKGQPPPPQPAATPPPKPVKKPGAAPQGVPSEAPGMDKSVQKGKGAVHTKKFDEVAEAVKREGSADNPYAVAMSVLGPDKAVQAGHRAEKSLAKSVGKEGEGSRGGHIIGHTSGGKPIYASSTQWGASGASTAHPAFTAKDHAEAAEVLRGKGEHAMAHTHELAAKTKQHDADQASHDAHQATKHAEKLHNDPNASAADRKQAHNRAATLHHKAAQANAGTPASEAHSMAAHGHEVNAYHVGLGSDPSVKPSPEAHKDQMAAEEASKDVSYAGTRGIWRHDKAAEAHEKAAGHQDIGEKAQKYHQDMAAHHRETAGALREGKPVKDPRESAQQGKLGLLPDRDRAGRNQPGVEAGDLARFSKEFDEKSQRSEQMTGLRGWMTKSGIPYTEGAETAASSQPGGSPQLANTRSGQGQQEGIPYTDGAAGEASGQPGGSPQLANTRSGQGQQEGIQGASDTSGGMDPSELHTGDPPDQGLDMPVETTGQQPDETVRKGNIPYTEGADRAATSQPGKGASLENTRPGQGGSGIPYTSGANSGPDEPLSEEGQKKVEELSGDGPPTEMVARSADDIAAEVASRMDVKGNGLTGLGKSLVPFNRDDVALGQRERAIQVAKLRKGNVDQQVGVGRGVAPTPEPRPADLLGDVLKAANTSTDDMVDQFMKSGDGYYTHAPNLGMQNALAAKVQCKSCGNHVPEMFKSGVCPECGAEMRKSVVLGNVQAPTLRRPRNGDVYLPHGVKLEK